MNNNNNHNDDNDNDNDDNSDGDSDNINDNSFKVCLDAKDKPDSKPEPKSTSDEVGPCSLREKNKRPPPTMFWRDSTLMMCCCVNATRHCSARARPVLECRL